MIKESERIDKFQRYIESLTRPSIQETRSGSDVGRRGSVMLDQPPRAAATMAASDDPRYGSHGFPPAVRNRDVPVKPEHGYVVPRYGDPSYGPSWSPSDQPTSGPTGRSYGDRYFSNTSEPSPSYTSYDYGSAAIPSPSTPPNARRPQTTSRDSIPRNPNLATQYTDGLISPRPSRSKLNEFFVSGDGIHREVLQREICKYLGPEAFSRPSSHNV